jgi:hypothetical protein
MVEGCHKWEPFESEYFMNYGDFSGISWPGLGILLPGSPPLEGCAYLI